MKGKPWCMVWLIYQKCSLIKCGLSRPDTALCSHHLPEKRSKCFSHSQQRPSYAFRILWVRANSTLLHFWFDFRKSCTQKYLTADWNFPISSWDAIKFAWELSFSSWACIMCWVSCNPFTEYVITIWYIIWNPAKTYLRNKLSHKLFLKNFFSIIIKSPFYIH